MKPRWVIMAILFAAFVISGQAPSDITTQVNERRNTDGTLRWRVERTSRGETPVLRVHQSNRGGMTGTTRSYLAGGELLMMESDDDGDGIFETIIVYRPGKSDMEAFTRQGDGSVQPVSTRALAAYKKQHAAITELWDKAFDEDMDPEKFVEKVRQTQEKIRDANEIISKTAERDRDKDGRPDLRYETLHRGDKIVMLIGSEPDAQGVMTVRSRSFYAGGDMVMNESDEDGDGFFETLVVYHPGTTDMEVFTRQRDGSVRPVSGEALAAYKIQRAAISEFFETGLDKGIDTDKAMELMMRRIQAVEDEKSDAKK